jgi:hypothetical protein
VDAPVRAIVHLLNGEVRRGMLQPGDLRRPILIHVPGGTETHDPQQIKVVFLLREPGQQPPRPSGDRVVVTLIDGRSLTGFSTNTSSPDGFSVIPAETKGNTARVFVYPWAVRHIRPLP